LLTADAQLRAAEWDAKAFPFQGRSRKEAPAADSLPLRAEQEEQELAQQANAASPLRSRATAM
jgi:hypothetical protein